MLYLGIDQHARQIPFHFAMRMATSCSLDRFRRSLRRSTLFFNNSPVSDSPTMNRSRRSWKSVASTSGSSGC